MSRVIGGRQTCGIKSRTIQTNVHVAHSVLHTSADSGGQVALVEVDLAKAFGRVNPEILFALFEHVNVGRTILDGVRLCYRNCITRLIVNGNASAPISFESSFKQGCPMSPFLFALYLESLCLRVQNSRDVRAYRFYSEEVKVVAYADDVAFFCLDKPSVDGALQLTQQLFDATGAQVHNDKCSDLWFGTCARTPIRCSNNTWSCTAPTFPACLFTPFVIVGLTEIQPSRH